MLNQGIHLNAMKDIEKIISLVRNHKTFKRGNALYNERGFAFDFKGRKIFGKIYYYHELTFPLMTLTQAKPF